MMDVLQLLEKAVRDLYADWMHPVKHADVVLQVMPVWASAKTLRAITGLNRDQINRMAVAHKVVAKIADGSVIYRVADVLAAIDEMPERNSKEACRDLD